MCEYLGVILRPHWEVELVEDGRAALASAIEDPPDLILSDVMMPQMDGVALVISNLELVLDELRKSSRSSAPGASELEAMVNEARQGAARVAQIVSSMKTFARAGEERRIALDVRPLLDLAVSVAFNALQRP